MTAARLWALTVAIGVLLLASLALAGIRTGWHLHGHTAVMPLQVAVSTPQTAQLNQRDTVAITTLAPFGQAAVLQKAQPAASAVRLNVALRGVLLDGDPTQSRAFVLVSGTTATYRLGETVQSAELVAINADTITLRTDAGLHVIGFDGLIDDQAGTGTATASAPSPDAKEPADPLARLAAAIVPGNGSIDLREAPPAETTQEYIDLWRDRISNNPQAAMDTVGVEVVENGYRVKADPNIGVTLAGLKPGDVITSLNGQTVGDLARDKELYDEVAASGIARLEVFRNGKAILLTFPLR
jgi:general secretion pathway protein C